jgi:hypothetical protein
MRDEKPSPAQLQKLADLLTTPVLNRTGFHEMFCWLQKDVQELGYTSVSEFIEDYEWADALRDFDMLDDYLPPNDEPEFEVYTVTFPKP